MGDTPGLGHVVDDAAGHGSKGCWCGLPDGHYYRANSSGETVRDRAHRLLAGDREKEYGNARDTHERIAAMWNAIIPQGARIRPVDVALMMAGLKIIRAAKNPAYEDSWTDLVGYAEIGARLGKVDV